MDDQKRAVFFGGSRGIGRTLALEAARRNIRPLVVARRFDSNDTELLAAAYLIAADVTLAYDIGKLIHEPVWHQPYVFWVAGGHRSGPLANMEVGVDRIIDTHYRAMIEVVRELHRTRLTMRDRGGPDIESQLPYTLVVMGSISSYLLRSHEAVYAGVKAAQAAFLRNYASELVGDFPGSKILLVNCARIGDKPGEQKLEPDGRRIDPDFVAKLVWDLLQGDGKITDRPFTQVNITRTSGEPDLSWGPQLPEIP